MLVLSLLALLAGSCAVLWAFLAVSRNPDPVDHPTRLEALRELIRK